MRDVHYWYAYMRLSGYDHWAGLFLSLELLASDRR